MNTMFAKSSNAGIRPRARIRPWIQAARPIAHPMIFIPLVIGQAMAFGQQGQFSVFLWAHTLLFGVLYQVYLLYLNDYADQAVDRLNTQHWFSGGSRVLPDGKLAPRDLRVGANVALALMIGLTVFLASIVDRPLMIAGIALAIALCWAYNLKPLQLSYRGYGEVLQGLGCGVLLPLIGFYMQQGTLAQFPWGALIPLYLVFHAGNIITALPDFPSDSKGGKRTYPVRHGEHRARSMALTLLTVAYGSFVLANIRLPMNILAAVVVPSALVLIAIVLSGLHQGANTADFPRCKRFVTWTSVSQAWFLCAWSGALLMSSST
ncbi:MAG: prenyltransferase [Pseudomonadota bacterium]